MERHVTRKKTQIHKKSFKHKNMIAGLLLFCILAIGSTYVYGKYYATRFNKGVAIASNLFFNSDKLIKSAGITDLDTIANDAESIRRINVFTNAGPWASGNTTLYFEIRNYDNNILFNETNLDIGYHVEFILLDEPAGANYSAMDADGTMTPLVHQGDKVTYTGTIAGGSLTRNSYGVTITLNARPENYQPARVLVLAYPTSPDYVKREPQETHENRLLGIFEGHLTDISISIESAKFKVQDSVGYNDSSWKTKVADLSGYIYNIKTAGDVVLDSNTASKSLVNISWDHRYLKLDMYDENYQYALEHDRTETDESKKYLTTDGNITSMKILVLPYTSIDTTFYKTDDFDTALNSQPANATGRAWFEELVQAVIVE